MILHASSSKNREVLEVAEKICEETSIICYKPRDIETSILSLTWLETLQYADEECVKDFECIENMLRSFGYALKMAIEYEYSFSIDLEKIAIAKAWF